MRYVVPLDGFTDIIVGGVSSTGPPEGGLMDAHEYKMRMKIEYLEILILNSIKVCLIFN